jgi:uncharacterized lipoprotein YajG
MNRFQQGLRLLTAASILTGTVMLAGCGEDPVTHTTTSEQTTTTTTPPPVVSTTTTTTEQTRPAMTP